MFDLESSISAWRSQMLASGIHAPVPLEELESHLRDHIQQLTASGQSAADAFAIAAARLGDAPALKKEFTKVSRNRFAIWRGNPASLNLIGLWLIIVGINASTEMRIWFKLGFGLSRFSLFGLTVNLLLVLQLVAGIGLLLRGNFWRRFTIGWSSLVLGLFAFSLAWHFFTASGGASPIDSSLGLTVVGGPTGAIRYYFLRLPLPMPFLHIISAVNIAALASGIYLLTRPSLRALFEGNRQPEKQPTTDN